MDSEKAGQIKTSCRPLVDWAEQAVKQRAGQPFDTVTIGQLIPMRFVGCLARPRRPEFVAFLLDRIGIAQKAHRALRSMRFKGMLTKFASATQLRRVGVILEELEVCLAGITSFQVVFEAVDIVAMVLDWLNTMPPPAAADPDLGLATSGSLFGQQSLEVLEAILASAQQAKIAAAVAPAKLSSGMRGLLAGVSEQDWQTAFGIDQFKPLKLRFERRILTRELVVNRIPPELIKEVQETAGKLLRKEKSPVAASGLVKTIRNVLQPGQGIVRPMAILSQALGDQGHGSASKLVDAVAQLLS